MLKSLPRCLLGNRRSLLWLMAASVFLHTLYRVSQHHGTPTTYRGRELTESKTGVSMTYASVIREEVYKEQVVNTTNVETPVPSQVYTLDEEVTKTQLDTESNEEVLSLTKDMPTVDLEGEMNTNNNTVLEDQSHILLLSSMGRSGSSFLGGLLNAQPGTFYFYEPLHELGKWDLNSYENAVETLSQIFYCNISSSLTRKAIASRHSIIIRNPYVDHCGGRDSCMKNLNAACSKQPLRVIKTIRTRVSWLTALLQDTSLNFKVIQLVRDPRASLLSAWKRGWKTSAEESCKDLSEDLINGMILRDKYPGRYLAVRYEDICAEPNIMAKIIYSFLGHKNLPPTVVRYLEEKTSGSIHGSPYGINRNTRKMQQIWREDISQYHLMKIEENCVDAINSIGFNVFGTMENCRNLSMPLYFNQTFEKYFTYQLENPESPP